MRHRYTVTMVGLLIVVLAAACFAGDTQERVAPIADQNRMHLSVVGIVNNAEYAQITSWFQRDADLAALRKTTHFHPVNAGSAIYEERYAPNVRALPTVRLQAADGVVIYESAGAEIPKTPAALASAIESKTSQLFNPPLLPWRSKVERKCGPGGCPQQQAAPEEDIPPEEEFNFAPMTPVPELEPEGVNPFVVVLLAIAAAVGGGVGALVSSIKSEMK